MSGKKTRLVGAEEASGHLAEELGAYSGSGVRVLMVCGPTGCGKTTLIRESLSGYSCFWHGPDGGDASGMIQFCTSQRTVHDMLMGGAPKKAVVMDDGVPEQKGAARIVDMLKRVGASAVVVYSCSRKSKSPEMLRRANRVVTITYPPAAALFAHLADKHGGEVPDEILWRCVKASGGSVPKAESLIEGERYGTVAAASEVRMDATVYENVAFATDLVRGGAPICSVYSAVHGEPFMAFMIVRGSCGGITDRVRKATRDLSRVPPGSSEGDLASAVAFIEAVRSVHVPPASAMRFPRCYTTASARVSSLRRRNAADR